jgi:hypothetical protein
VRDKARGILLHALAPDEALSREEAAAKLEAALYASCAGGKPAKQPGQPAEPGVPYMRRLKVLWSWLDGSSPHRSPGLKCLFLEGAPLPVWSWRPHSRSGQALVLRASIMFCHL